VIASIPWDIWAAAVLAVVVALVAIFEPSAAAFIAICTSTWIYVVIEAFSAKSSGHR
jgi:hypothetical protein